MKAVCQFGNWAVGSDGIIWQGKDSGSIVLSFEKITTTGRSKNAIIYEWLVDVARDRRFTTEDIYSLNTAFIYALDFMLGQFEIPQYALIAETLKEQQAILKERTRGLSKNNIASTQG